MHILNTEQHHRTSLIVEPFGKDGAVHLTPVRNGMPGDSFILDAPAAAQLGDFLTELQRETI
jgi:hypothetical protein